MSSYALPPQSYLSAPPCSYLCKRAPPKRHERQTFFTIRNGSGDQNLRLVRIKEEQVEKSKIGQNLQTPERKEFRLRGTDVISINILPTYNGDQLELARVLVFYKTGSVDCIYSDFSGSAWEYTMPGQEQTAVEVEYATVLDLKTAHRGLLKSREDVLAVLESTTTENGQIPNNHLLCRIVRSQTRTELQLLSMRPLLENLIRNHGSPLQQLMSCILPSRARRNSETAKYDLHEASGFLYMQLDHRLTVFDLSGTVPKIAFEVGRKRIPSVVSFSRLSGSSVLVLSDDSIAVYEKNYGSILSSLPYSMTSFVKSTGNNHEDDGPSSTSRTLECVSSFPDIGLAVVLFGTELVALQISSVLKDNKQVRSKGALLIDAMWNGKNNTGGDLIEKAGLKKKKRKRLNSWKERVDQLASKNDVEQLEVLLAKDLGLLDSKAAGEPEAKIIGNGGLNGQTILQDHLWPLPSSAWDAQHLDSTKALYVLSKIFTWRSLDSHTLSTPSRLEIAVKSRNILRWLAMAGLLSLSYIREAISHSASGKESNPPLMPGAIIAAVGRIDTEFILLCDLLSLPIHWDLADLLQAMKLLIESLQSGDDQTHALSEEMMTITDRNSTNGDVEAQIIAEADAAELDLQHASAVIESGLHVRSETFRQILTRLQGFPRRLVAHNMRLMMSHSELIFFIQILRVELAEAGWTSRYVDTDETELESETLSGLPNTNGIDPNNQAIRSISDLLDCAVDAIGISGWLIGGSSDLDSTENLIDNLRAEISAALEGCYEAHTLDVLLKEIRRCAGSDQNLKRKWQNEEISLDQAVLPLGGKANPPVVKTRHTKSIKMAKYALEENKSSSIGKYSFERIYI